MARFRYHRGSLAESLSTEIQANNLQDIATDMGFPDAILRCEFYSEDLRPTQTQVIHQISRPIPTIR